MKTLEKLLAEYKIRFKETEEIDGIDYPFTLSDLFPNIDSSILVEDKENWEVHSVNGKVAQCLKGRIFWATAKITEKPKRWVVKKDEQHPMWERFLEYTENTQTPIDKESSKHMYHSLYYSEDDLLIFRNYQLLTLDQWAELFLDEPKEYHLFWDKGVDSFLIGELKGFARGSYSEEITGARFQCSHKLSPELTAMLVKEIKQIQAK